jgi:hypothetical protein
LTALNIVDGSLNDGDDNSSVTVSFSEAITDASFTQADLVAQHGTISNLVIAADHKSATATFTADQGFEGSGSVSIAAGAFADAVGNLSEGTASDTVTIDT